MADRTVKPVVALRFDLEVLQVWTRRRWGHRLALTVLGINLMGDALNAALRGDARTLIGLPIGGAMIAYLLSHRVRQWFASPPG